MVDKHALRYLWFERHTVARPQECFRKCRLNCRCVSFNYWPIKNETNCEMNRENRHTAQHALQPDGEAQYYDLVMDYNVLVRISGNVMGSCTRQKSITQSGQLPY